MTDNLIQIGKRPKRIDPDRTLEAVRVGKCSHPRFTVDQKLNDVECAVCKERLNPIWVLGQLANQESQLAERRNKLMALVKKLSGKVRYKCRSCGKMNDMARIVKVSSREYWESSRAALKGDA